MLEFWEGHDHTLANATHLIVQRPGPRALHLVQPVENQQHQRQVAPWDNVHQAVHQNCRHDGPNIWQDELGHHHHEGWVVTLATIQQLEKNLTQLMVECWVVFQSLSKQSQNLEKVSLSGYWAHTSWHSEQFIYIIAHLDKIFKQAMLSMFCKTFHWNKVMGSFLQDNEI